MPRVARAAGTALRVPLELAGLDPPVANDPIGRINVSNYPSGETVEAAEGAPKQAADPAEIEVYLEHSADDFERIA